MFTVNNWPEICPFGHTLRPGTGSLSWDTELKRHWLYCGGCQRRSRVLLGEDAEWQVHTAGEWVTRPA